MTKEDVKKTFRGTDGKAIALAMRQYFAERIVEKKIHPLEFYKAGDFEKNINGEKDIVSKAEELFTI